MGFHLGCELLDSSGLYLNHWHDDVFMKSCLACELLGNFWALFESMICIHEILSRMWVAGHLPSSIWINDMHSWNLVQDVSCCAPPRFCLNHWHVFYEILSSMWVPVHFPGSIWITDMSSMKSCPGCEFLCISQAPFESLTCLLWNPVQLVSCCAFPRLHLNHWHVFYEILSSLWVSVLFPGSIWHVFYEILSRVWVAVHLPGFIWITDMPSMKFCTGCELLCTSQALFESLTCLLWNPVQFVSCCAPPRLHLNHWHAFYKILSRLWVAVHIPSSIWITDMPSIKSCPGCELLCTSQALFEPLTCLL